MNLRLELSDLLGSFSLFSTSKALLEAVDDVDGTNNFIQQNYPDLYAIVTNNRNVDDEILNLILSYKGTYKSIEYLNVILGMEIKLYDEDGNELTSDSTPTTIKKIRIDTPVITNSDYSVLSDKLISALRSLVWYINSGSSGSSITEPEDSGIDFIVNGVKDSVIIDVVRVDYSSILRYEYMKISPDPENLLEI